MAISETPRRRMDAITRAHLAELAMELGVTGEAATEFERAARLFDQLQRPPDQSYRVLAQLSLTQADLVGHAPNAAVKRLEAIGNPQERSMRR